MHVISRKMCLEKKISKNRKLEFRRKARKSSILIIFYILKKERKRERERERERERGREMGRKT